MQGEFKKNKNVWNIISIVSGILLIVLFAVLIPLTDEEPSGDTLSSALFGILLGAAVIAIGTVSILFNRKAYFIIEDDTVKAKFGWKAELITKIEDITGVFAGGTLDIEVNGKVYSVFGMTNAFEIYEYLKMRVPVNRKYYDERATYLEQYKAVKDKRKADIVFIIAGIIVMIGLIVAAVIYTGGKDIAQMVSNEKIIILIFGLLEVVNLVVLFVVANASGKRSRKIQALGDNLKSAAVVFKPLESGKVLKVFTDPYYTGRFTVFSGLNNKNVYYTLESVDDDFKLNRTFTSEALESFDKIKPVIDEFGLTDITDKIEK